MGTLEGTILLKTDRMRRVEIDAERRVARVEAGTIWIEAVEAAAEHGLATLAGSSPDVGVVGYTLGVAHDGRCAADVGRAPSPRPRDRALRVAPRRRLLLRGAVRAVPRRRRADPGGEGGDARAAERGRPLRGDHTYLNFAERRRKAPTLFSSESYHRLRRIKALCDPADTIRSNHPIPPAH